MFCPKCGTELFEEANFCFKCGCAVSKYKTPLQAEADSFDKTLGTTATVGPGQSESIGDVNTIGPSLSSPQNSPRYEILSTIGQGGMGVVYKARDNRLRRIIALKRLRTDLSNSQSAIDRFFNEAKSIATLNHQNIVQIYDYGEDFEGHYIAMEYVDGVSIKDYLKEKGKLDTEEATRIILGLARGLAIAHEKGVIHRDIKPGNILLDKNNRAKLTDFGLARVIDSEDITRTGFMMGTPDYCSPEQLRDAKNVDYRTDIYSLGATFY
jgi:serine/threonine protein kinase